MDNECNLYDSGEFSKSYPDIYPQELQQKCEHHGTHISVADNIFVYKLFDKRDDFPFTIIHMPDRSGNIRSHVFYGLIKPERNIVLTLTK